MDFAIANVPFMGNTRIRLFEVDNARSLALPKTSRPATKNAKSRQELGEWFIDAAGIDRVTAMRQVLRDRLQGAFLFQTDLGSLSPDEQIFFGIALASAVAKIRSLSFRPTCFDEVLLTATNPPYMAHRQHAFNPDVLHTDGKVDPNRADDWIMLTIPELRNAEGGESLLLHIDDWAERDQFRAHPMAERDVIFAKANVGAITRDQFAERWGKDGSLEVETGPLFYNHHGSQSLRLSGEFMHSVDPNQYGYIDELQASVQNDPSVISWQLAPGQYLMVNNRFWLHGRNAFKRDPEIFRRLVRLKGVLD